MPAFSPMKRFANPSVAACVVAAVLTPAAMAHTGNSAGGLTSGLQHPLTGFDHLLALIGVGLWSARVGGSGRWLAPAAFAGMMLLGAWGGLFGLKLPIAEPMIAASVLVFGLLTMPSVRSAPWLGGLLAGLFALFHGHAHGEEIAAGGPVTPYLAGLFLSSALVLGASLALACAARRAKAEWPLGIIGVAMGACGLAMLT